MPTLHHAFSAALLVCSVALSARTLGEPSSSNVDDLLRRAFEARYGCTVTGVIEIETRKGGMEALKRRLEIATKSIGDRLHTYAIFREPPYVRGVAFLGIEPEGPGSSEERFVYLPSMRKIRRVSGSQNDDAFLGTDLSYHDFERQRGESFRVALGHSVEIDGEPAWVVTARPRAPAGYERVEHTISSRDLAILGTRYFKRGSEREYKQLWMERARIIESGACRVPTRIRVADRQRGTETVLTLSQLQLDAVLSDDLFSMIALETKRPIPGLRN